MADEVVYSPHERRALWLLMAIGVVGVNGAFVVGLLQPGTFRSALANPIAAAFMGEAVLLLGMLAYLFTKWRVTRLRWPWFVLLSLLGSMVFAIPIALLCRDRQSSERS